MGDFLIGVVQMWVLGIAFGVGLWCAYLAVAWLDRRSND